jgi:hypothetical protein
MKPLVALLMTVAVLLLPGTVLARSHAGAASNAQSFQVPWSSWPSDSTNQTGQILSPSDADNANKNPFADDHVQLYKTHGMQGGYLQAARVVLNPSSTEFTDQFDISWLGSYYASGADAASMVGDAVRNMAAQGFSGQSCFLDDQPNCHLFISLNVVYAVWSTQNGVAELQFTFDPTSSESTLAHGQSRMGHDFQRLLIGADATLLAAVGSNATPAVSPPSTPTPAPTIGIADITIYHDVNGRLVSTKTLHNKDLAVFLVTLRASNFGSLSASGDIKIYFPKGTMQLIQPLVPTDNNPATSKVIFDGTVDLQGQLSSGQWVSESFGTFEGESYFGPLTGVITLNLNTASDTRTFTFTLKQASLHCKKGYKLQQETCVKKGK